MDSAKEIAELKAERTALEQQLAAPGISEAKEHDLHQRIIAYTAEITALYKIVAHAGTAGGLPRETVAIQVAMELDHPTKKLLPYAVDAFADMGCNYPLLLSEKTWAHVVEHFADAIIPCDERGALAVGTMSMTQKAALNVRVKMSDGSWVESCMDAYKSDKDLLGLIGLESLGLLVDAPRKCLMRAIMLAGTHHHFQFNPASTGSQVKRDGPPPTSPQRADQNSAAPAARSGFPQSAEVDFRTTSADLVHRFLPKTPGHPVCKVCGKRSFEHETT